MNIIVRTFAQPGDPVGFYEPTFPLYKVQGMIHGARVVPVRVPEPYDRPPDPPANVRVFFLANPNSPVGFAYPISRVAELAKKVQGIFVIDEAYAEFAGENALTLARDFKNVLIVRTVSKSYSLAGARLGYAIGPEELIREMFKVKDPFNVNRLTQAVVSAALEDQEYFRKNIFTTIQAREWFSREASALGYRIIPSQANFVFPQPPQKGRGVRFYQTLFEQKVLTRYYDEEGLRDGVRMTIGTPEEMVFRTSSHEGNNFHYLAETTSYSGGKHVHFSEDSEIPWSAPPGFGRCLNRASSLKASLAQTRSSISALGTRTWNPRNWSERPFSRS